MNKIYHVLITYATRRLLMLILLLITVSGVVMISAAESSHRGSDSSDMRPMLTLLFPIAMLNLYLGAFLKQQIATHRAALVPGYRTSHLIAAALVVLFPLTVFTVTSAVNSLPLPGIVGMMAIAAVAGLNGSNGSHLVIWLGYGFLMATFFVPHLRAAIFEMLNGQQPGMAWSLISAAMAGAALLFHRLATLTEDDSEFGKVMPMNPWDLRAATLRTQTRSAMQRRSSFSEFISCPASRRLDRITSRPATTLWQRVVLLRLGVDTPVNVWWLAFFMAFFGTVMLIPTMSFDDPQQILRSLLMSAAMAQICLWNPTFRRSSRLGYESLRPQTRRRWVIENALAIALNTVILQSVIVCLNPFLIAAFLHGKISVPLILTTLMSFVGVQVFVFGLFFWVASFSTRVSNVIAVAAICGGLSSVIMMDVLNPSSAGRQIPIALITSGSGIAFCGFAYRRWCRIDLE